MIPDTRMINRLERLQEHLKAEAPILVEVVDRYKQLDKIAHKIGLLGRSESYTTQISWWPMISVLGTFSAGKSSFINSLIDLPLQKTGNQAVDDRFTVITYTEKGKVRTLPGLALDGDARFPFYQISEDIEGVAEGEGSKVDNYLQMKVAPSEILKGKIFIDSPGFDADEQRKSTLRITDHIIELSDLVLVLFDARHPEPGAMKDTLEHLVNGAQRRNDSSKFLFILNQIDTSAKDDNLEEIIASWQKALVQYGLTSGRFFVLYNEDLAVPVENEGVWERYKAKRDVDYQEILARIDSITVERVYRIVGNMESMANHIENQSIPRLTASIQRWKKRVVLADIATASLLIILALSYSIYAGYWQGLSFSPSWLASFSENHSLKYGVLGGMTILLVGLHFYYRKIFANSIAKKLSTDHAGNLEEAFCKSTKIWRSLFLSKPSGWGNVAQRRIDALRDDTDRFVQRLNDNFAKPSGE
ncbi:MAG: dynamin family protein [Thiotrichaceae bacterium]|nr:dynamin family protein [Thiotrichaceae bacterium]